MVVVAIATLIIAWFVGARWAASDIESYLKQALPSADHFERISADTYAAYQGATAQQLIGYVTIGEADGFGGPMEVAVAVDLEGNVLAGAGHC